MARKRTRPKRTPEQLRKSREAAARYKARHPERVAAADRRTKAAWKARDPEGFTRYKKANDLRKKSLTIADLDRMIAAQGGRCAICGVRFEDAPKGMANIDHNHECCPQNHACERCRRALLCYNCNSGLGQFKDDPLLLEVAAHYLRAFPLPPND